MLKVGVTGGIGSGKTMVCRVFQTLGVPVFNADEAGRSLLRTDERVKAAVRALLGNGVFEDGFPVSSKIAAAVFGNPELLASLNAIIHPATIAAANQWVAAQTTPYVIKEAAIFFESGTYTEMDVMVGVSAPLEVRISRAMARSGMTRDEVLARINRQMDEAEKMRRCRFVLVNDDVQPLLPQVLKLHQTLLGLSRG